MTFKTQNAFLRTIFGSHFQLTHVSETSERGPDLGERAVFRISVFRILRIWKIWTFPGHSRAAPD